MNNQHPLGMVSLIFDIENACENNDLDWLQILCEQAKSIKEKKDNFFLQFFVDSVKYDRKEQFFYFLSFLGEDIEKPSTQEQIIFHCLYGDRMDYLDCLIKNSNFDLSQYIDVSHFQILLESNFYNLEHIITHYNYRPNEKVLSNINQYLSKNRDDRFSRDLSYLMGLIDKTQLHNSLNSDLNEQTIQNDVPRLKL